MHGNMRPACVGALVALVFLAAGSVSAEPDSFYLGTERDGSPSYTTGSVIINSYANVTMPVGPGDRQISIAKVSPATGAQAVDAFQAGHLVMILQTTGIVPVAQTGVTTPVDLGASNVGRWEFARLEGVNGSVLRLTAPLINSYAANVTQVIRVPEYKDFTINGNAIVTAKSWDGHSGGVIALLATGKVDVKGSIQAKGVGFRGGAYAQDTSNITSCVQEVGIPPGYAQKGEGVDITRFNMTNDGGGRGNVANGAGGGNCLRLGGGGGGNAGKGGTGGISSEAGGMEGASLIYSMLDRLTFGGGGGSGHGSQAQTEPPNQHSSGGAGGGIVFIRARDLTVNSNSAISALGDDGLDGGSADAGGGGGAGGTILVRLTNLLNCDGKTPFTARGGKGGSAAPVSSGPSSGGGGGGGGGRLLYQMNMAANCSNLADLLTVGGGIKAPTGSADGLSGIISSIPGGFPLLDPPEVKTLGRINRRRPTITGTAGTGKQVVIYLDDLEIGRTYATGKGDFSFIVPQDLADRGYNVQAAVAEQGIQSTKSPAVSFIVDTLQPAAPIVKTLGGRNSVASRGMLLGIADLLLGNSLPIKGLAEPGSAVTVRQFDSGGNVLGQGTVSAEQDGSWSVSLRQPLGLEASYTLEVKALDEAQNESLATTLDFDLDAKVPTPAPVLRSVGGVGMGSGVVLVNTQWPILEGSAEPQSRLNLLLKWQDATGQGMEIPLQTYANALGTWSIVPPVALQQFEHIVELTSYDLAENSSSGAPRSFNVDVLAPSKPVVKQVGALGREPRQGMLVGTPDLTSSTSSLSINGTAELKSSVTVRQVCADGSEVQGGPVIVNEGDGSWSLSLSQMLGLDTSCTLEVKARDAAQNESVAYTLGFRLDTLVPSLPAVSKIDGIAPSTDCASSSILPLIKNRKPFIEGTGEPMGRIEVALQAQGHGTFPQPETLVNSLPSGTGYWGLAVTQPEAGLPDSVFYSLAVAVTDEAGNRSLSATYCFALDATVPQAPTIATLGQRVAVNGMRIGPAELANDGSLSIGGEAEGGSVVELRLIPMDPSQQVRKTEPGVPTGTWSDQWELLPSGNYAVEARVRDAAGNLSVPRVLFFELDLISPTVEIFQHPDSLTTSKEAVFGFRSSEALSRYECAINGSQASECVNPFTYTVPKSGVYEIKVWGIDLVGNRTKDAQAPTYKWTVDSDLPIAFILNQSGIPNNGQATNQTEIEFELQANKDGLRIDCQIDLGEWDEDCDCTTTRTDGSGRAICVKHYSGLRDDPHVFMVRAYSSATGVMTPQNEQNKNEWVVDTQKPDTFVAERPGEWVAADHVTIIFAAPSEPRVPRFQCELNGQKSVCSSPYVLSMLSDKFYMLRIKAVDAAGNEEESPAEISWTVDTEAPVVPIVFSPTEGERYKEVRVNGLAAGEPFSTISLYLDAKQEPLATVKAGSTGEWQLVLADEKLPMDGSHLLQIVTTDRAGNSSVKSEPINFVVDTTPPIVEVVEGPAERVNTTSAQFRFAVEGGEDATLMCSLDAGEFAACDKEIIYSDLDEGPHAIYVRATDAAGNVGPAAIHNWKIFLSGEAHVQGGGVSCAATAAGSPMLWLLSLIWLLLSARRHERSRGGGGQSHLQMRRRQPRCRAGWF